MTSGANKEQMRTRSVDMQNDFCILSWISGDIAIFKDQNFESIAKVKHLIWIWVDCVGITFRY